MIELTKRQMIALEMLKGHLPLIIKVKDKQSIRKALDLADYFIEISENGDKPK